MFLDSYSYTSKGGRSYNQDAVGISETPESALYIVADGLGGHLHGEMASKSAVDTLLAAEAPKKGVQNEWLETQIKQANANIIELQEKHGNMKTTIVALSINGDQAAWAHVGDTRLYHFLNGKLIFQTRDHSASQLAVMLGEITPQEIRFHEDRNRVLRALGQEGELSIEASQAQLGPGSHAFLLCSDGFWEYVLEDEMEEDLRLASTEEEWIVRMHARLCKRIPSDNDNNTAAAVWCLIY